jgi:hypothetical protein
MPPSSPGTYSPFNTLILAFIYSQGVYLSATGSALNFCNYPLVPGGPTITNSQFAFSLNTYAFAEGGVTEPYVLPSTIATWFQGVIDWKMAGPGRQVMFSVGGAWPATQLGTMYQAWAAPGGAQQVAQGLVACMHYFEQANGLPTGFIDGIDFDFEDSAAMVAGPNQWGPAMLTNVTLATRAALNASGRTTALISHAPQTPYFAEPNSTIPVNQTWFESYWKVLCGVAQGKPLPPTFFINLQEYRTHCNT